jgi:hypothetical protein
MLQKLVMTQKAGIAMIMASSLAMLGLQQYLQCI